MEKESKIFHEKVRLLDIRGAAMFFAIGEYTAIWEVYHTYAVRDICLTIGRNKTPRLGGTDPEDYDYMKKKYPIERESKAWLQHDDARKVLLLLTSPQAAAFWEVWSIAVGLNWRSASRHVEHYLQGLSALSSGVPELLRGVLIHLGLRKSTPARVAELTEHVKAGAGLGLWEERWVENFRRAGERATWRKILGK